MVKRKDIIPKDSRYIPFSQQPYCCVPTSIQMVMYRHGIPLIPAELLGYYLGLTVPKRAAGFFWNANIGKRAASQIRPIAGYGTMIYEKKFEPNKVFKKLKIPLRMELRPVSSFRDFMEFKNYLAGLAKKDFDVLLCFHHGTLVNDPSKDNGHVVVLDKVYLTEQKIRFVDPTRGPKWKIFSMKKMYEAMKAHNSSKVGGFWELFFIRNI
ncbi:MAG: hypothetical protein AAB410_02540 [Patescibacteria group bacterium]